MAITYVTGTGVLYSPGGAAAPLRNRRVVIEAATADGLLSYVTEDAVFAGKYIGRTNTVGELTMALPQLPQAGLEPPNAQWRMTFPADLNVSPIYFTAASNFTWAEKITVGSVEPTLDLIAQMNALAAVIGGYARRASVIEAFGHSYTTDGATDATYLWPQALKRMVGATTVNNYGVTGAKLVQGSGGGNSGGYIGAIRNIVPNVVRTMSIKVYSPNPGVVATTWGYNDAGDDATSTGTNIPAMVKAWKYAVRAAMSHFQGSAQFDQTATSTPAEVVLAGSGTWTAFVVATQNVGDRYFNNATSGATVTATLPAGFTGGVVALHFVSNRVSGTVPASAITFTVDSVATHPIGHSAADPFTTQGINPSAINSAGPAAARFNLSAGAHVIVATAATGGASYDRLIIEARPLPRPVLWANIARTPASTSTRLEAIAALNAATPLVGAEFPAGSFVLVDIDTPLDNDSAKFYDDTHPNDWGHALVAEAFGEAWTQLSLASGQLAIT